MTDFHQTTVGTGRRVTLPADLCRAYGLADGEAILLHSSEYGIVIQSLDRRAEQMRDELAAQVGGADLLADLHDLRSQDAVREADLGR